MSEVDLCDWCEEVLQPYLDRELTSRASERGGGPPRRLHVLPQALQVRGRASPARAARRSSSRWSPALKAKLVWQICASSSRDVSGRSSAKSTSPGGPRSSHGTRSAGSDRAPSSGICSQTDLREQDRVAAVAAVGGRDDLGAALPPDLEHAVDRGRRQVGPVAEDDDCSGRLGRERAQAATERGAAPALPVGAVDGRRRGGHVVRAEHDDRVRDRALPHPLEHRLEQDALLGAAEARRGARGQHHGCQLDGAADSRCTSSQ